MGSYGWRARASVAEGLFAEAHRFDFYQAVRLLEVMFPHRKRTGEAGDPDTDVVRFRSRVAFDFPPSDIDSLTRNGGGSPAEMLVNFMGLAGAQGPLPAAVTELVYRRARQNDPSFRDFLDIFNHRLVSLMYQARKKFRVALHTGTPDRHGFAGLLRALVGLGTPGVSDRMAVADRSLVRYAGQLSRAPRSMVGLTGILGHYFKVPVALTPFQGKWLYLDESQTTRLGRRGQNSVLGKNVVTGRRVWDQAAGAELSLGPLSRDEFDQFLPNGGAHDELTAITRFYAGEEIDFRARLTLKASEVPTLRLGKAGGALVGHTSWLYRKAPERDDSQVAVRLKTA